MRSPIALAALSLALASAAGTARPDEQAAGPSTPAPASSAASTPAPASSTATRDPAIQGAARVHVTHRVDVIAPGERIETIVDRLRAGGARAQPGAGDKDRGPPPGGPAGGSPVGPAGGQPGAGLREPERSGEGESGASPVRSAPATRPPPHDDDERPAPRR